MISRIEGILESVQDTSALVVVGDLVYEISVPASDIPELFMGGKIKVKGDMSLAMKMQNFFKF